MDLTDNDEEHTHHKQVKAIVKQFRAKRHKGATYTGAWFNDWLLVEFLRRFLIPQMGRIPTTISEIADTMAELLHVDRREVFFLQAVDDFIMPGNYKGPRHRDVKPEHAGPREVRKHEILMIQIDKTDRIEKEDRRVARVAIERCAIKEDSYPFWVSIGQLDSITKHLIFRPIVEEAKQSPKAIETLRAYYSKFLTDQLGYDIKVEITTRKDWHALLQRLQRLEIQKRKADILARRRDRLRRIKLRRKKFAMQRAARAKRQNEQNNRISGNKPKRSR